MARKQASEDTVTATLSLSSRLLRETLRRLTFGTPVGHLVGFTALWLLLTPAHEVVAEPLYRLVSFDVRSGASSSEAVDVNNLGQVLVHTRMQEYMYSQPVDYGDVWDNGIQTNIRPGGGISRFRPVAINDQGMVIGINYDPSRRRAVRWKWRGGISPSPDVDTGTSTIARGLNNQGEVVGSSLRGPPGSNPFLWVAETFTESRHWSSRLGSGFSWQDRAYPEDINDRGQTVGYAIRSDDIDEISVLTSLAWVLEDDEFTILPVPAHDRETDFTKALSVNEVDQIVGCYQFGTGQHALLWDSGTAIDLGDLLGGEDLSFAREINATGVIVGGGYNELGARAVLWNADGILFDLNELVDASANGWTLQEANAINDQGWIVGAATDPSSQPRGFLLIPVPEPSTLVLLSVGALFLFVAARRRCLSRHAPLPENVI